MKHFLVVGRMCGDDEDTGITYQVATREEAVILYVEDMWEMDITSVTNPDEMLAYRETCEANGQDVFINGIYESDSPIKEAT